MSESRLQLRMDPERKAVRSKDIDMDTDIRVDVNAKLSGLGLAGVVGLAIGIVTTLVGAVMVIVNYPSFWVPARIEPTVLVTAAGVTLLLVGASFYFHGRTVLGSGSLQHVHMDTSVGNSAPPPQPAEPQHFSADPTEEPLSAWSQVPSGDTKANGATFKPVQKKGYTYPENPEDPWSEVQP